MTSIIGIDASTQPKKLGLARGKLGRGKWLVIEQVVLASEVEPLAQTLASWIAGPTLLAIDAPLGWPIALGETLHSHRAGDGITTQANEMFRRETDRFVHRTLGKLPLEVGADRIARTARAALGLLDEVRKRASLDIPLAWSPEVGGVAAIEVYPAATLIARGLDVRGYKGTAGDNGSARDRLLDSVAEYATLEVDRSVLTASDDRLDAAICVLAGADFLRGLSVPPTADQLPRAVVEGWIWFAAPASG